MLACFRLLQYNLTLTYLVSLFSSAYPWCDPCRRNLLEEDSSQDEGSSSSNSSHDEGTHGEVVLKEVHTLECAKAQLDVHEKILELAEHTLSIDCVDALLASKESKCFSISP